MGFVKRFRFVVLLGSFPLPSILYLHLMFRFWYLGLSCDFLNKGLGLLPLVFWICRFQFACVRVVLDALRCGWVGLLGV